MSDETRWNWKVTYETALIACGVARSREDAELAAAKSHDGYVINGLNPDALAYFVDEAKRYAVNVYDCAGEFDSTACDDFESARETHQARCNEYPGKVVLVFNLDRCDYGTNGLTEEETEALS